MKVHFLYLPFLDIEQDHTIDFESRQSQINWFKSKTLHTEEVNIKGDALRTSITVKKNMDFFNGIDYLYLESVNNGWDYYYFITDVEYKTIDTTLLHLKLDVIQTYMFNYKRLESFVDRCHQKRWTDDGLEPIDNFEDEGFPLVDYYQDKVENIKGTGAPGMIITSTSPLGKMPNFTPPNSNGSGNGGSGGNGDCWEEGKCSPKAFRFLKGFEGFGPTLHDDGYGTLTIGYGVTDSEPEIFNQLIKEQPIPEERGAKVAYELLQKNYGLHILDSVKKLGCNKQCQFDALLSVAYNSGNGSITGQNSLTQAIALNPNDESVIRPIWQKFKITSNGIPSEGLRLRRIEECNMYFGKEFEIRPIEKIGGGTVTENNGDGWLPSG